MGPKYKSFIKNKFSGRIFVIMINYIQHFSFNNGFNYNLSLFVDKVLDTIPVVSTIYFMASQVFKLIVENSNVQLTGFLGRWQIIVLTKEYEIEELVPLLSNLGAFGDLRRGFVLDRASRALELSIKEDNSKLFDLCMDNQLFAEAPDQVSYLGTCIGRRERDLPFGHPLENRAVEEVGDLAKFDRLWAAGNWQQNHIDALVSICRFPVLFRQDFNLRHQAARFAISYTRNPFRVNSHFLKGQVGDARPMAFSLPCFRHHTSLSPLKQQKVLQIMIKVAELSQASGVTLSADQFPYTMLEAYFQRKKNSDDPPGDEYLQHIRGDPTFRCLWNQATQLQVDHMPNDLALLLASSGSLLTPEERNSLLNTVEQMSGEDVLKYCWFLQNIAAEKLFFNDQNIDLVEWEKTQNEIVLTMLHKASDAGLLTEELATRILVSSVLRMGEYSQNEGIEGNPLLQQSQEALIMFYQQCKFRLEKVAAGVFTVDEGLPWLANGSGQQAVSSFFKIQPQIQIILNKAKNDPLFLKKLKEDEGLVQWIRAFEGATNVPKYATFVETVASFFDMNAKEL